VGIVVSQDASHALAVLAGGAAVGAVLLGNVIASRRAAVSVAELADRGRLLVARRDPGAADGDRRHRRHRRGRCGSSTSAWGSGHHTSYWGDRELIAWLHGLLRAPEPRDPRGYVIEDATSAG
jgi:hypothetical protein